MRTIEYIKLDLLACDLSFFNSGRAGPLNTKTITTLPGVFLTWFRLLFLSFPFPHHSPPHQSSLLRFLHRGSPPRMILRTSCIFCSVSSSPLIRIAVISSSFLFYTKSLLSPRFAKTMTPLLISTITQFLTDTTPLPDKEDKR